MKAKLFVTVSMLLVSAFTALSVVGAPAYAADCPPNDLLGIPAWYSGLRVDPSGGNCDIKPIGDGGISLNVFIVKVALNVVRAGLVIAGYVAVFFIIKGGFSYMTAQGEPGNLTTAKQTITNAIIGLIIALLSSAIVGAIAGAIN